MYRANYKRAFDPWTDFWGMDDLFRTLPKAYHGYPVTSAWKDDDKATVELELPGIDPGDVDISVEGHTLSISGDRKVEDLGDKEHYQHRERWHGKFTKTFDLPYDVDSAKVEAHYKNGILTVTLPRAEADKPRRIEVTLN